MCVIAVAIKKDPDLSTLYKCESTNPHGGGVAWAERGYVHYKKGLKAEEMQELVDGKPFPHIFHFRIASVGKVIPSLCHPFVVKRKHNSDMAGVTKEPVLFHNGTIQEWRFMARLAGVTYPDFASDSMVLARIVSQRGTELLSHPTLTAGNRYAVLFPNGDVKTYGSFVHVGDVEYSNAYWNWNSNGSQGCSTSDYYVSKGRAAQDDLPMDEDDGDTTHGHVQCPECKARNVENDGKHFLCNSCWNIWPINPEKTTTSTEVEPVEAEDAGAGADPQPGTTVD